METDQKTIVLLVDDDPIFQKSCQRILNLHYQKDDFELLLASNGREAMEQLESLNKENRAIDLIFLDINMPVMNGFEFLEALSSDNYDIPPIVTMLTSSGLSEDVEKSKRYQRVENYIVKTIDIEEQKKQLINTIESLTSRS